MAYEIVCAIVFVTFMEPLAVDGFWPLAWRAPASTASANLAVRYDVTITSPCAAGAARPPEMCRGLLAPSDKPPTTMRLQMSLIVRDSADLNCGVPSATPSREWRGTFCEVLEPTAVAGSTGRRSSSCASLRDMIALDIIGTGRRPLLFANVTQCRRERDFCRRRQAPQTCLRDETYAQRHKSRPHRSRKSGRKWAFPQAGLPRRVSVNWMVGAPGLEPGTGRSFLV